MSRHVMRRMLLVCAIASASDAILSRSGAQQSGVSVTFLANEGVLLSAGGRKVLIDALFQEYRPQYALPADSTRRSLEAARAPFAGVDLILATHHHGDHFHPAQVAAHMRANPRAVLLTSQQVIDSLRGRVPAGDAMRTRFLSRTTAPGARGIEDVNGIRVQLLGLPHGGHPTVEHLGYIVELGGRRVLHMGDGDFSESSLAPLRLDTTRIDVALLPYGAVTDANVRNRIERLVRPRQLVAFHVGTNEGDQVARAVQAAAPGAVTFHRSLETRAW